MFSWKCNFHQKQRLFWFCFQAVVKKALPSGNTPAQMIKR